MTDYFHEYSKNDNCCSNLSNIVLHYDYIWKIWNEYGLIVLSAHSVRRIIYNLILL